MAGHIQRCCSNQPLKWLQRALSISQGLSLSLPRCFSDDPAHFTISPPLKQRLQSILDRNSNLSQQLSSGDQSSLNSKQWQQLNKEYGQTQAVSTAYMELLATRHQLDEARTLLQEQDDDLRQLAQEECGALTFALQRQETALVAMILPKDQDDQRGVILEVRAGAGGEEAALFAMDLLLMYQQFAALSAWQVEVLEVTKAEAGGCKYASLAITGEGAFGSLKFESGVHRVQRVPATESSGRIHTSTATVAVLPEAGEIDMVIRAEDLRIDTYRAGGAGGQHVNTTDSAVRITHLPSGMVVTCQDGRSQHKNKAQALLILRARLYEAEKVRRRDATAEERKLAIGSGDRNERIRTYNFPQGRVTDHRVNITEHGIDQVLRGERLSTFIDALQQQHLSELMDAVSRG